jgi:hypothetical protein
MTQLSPHFTLSEATKSQMAIRKGIANVPNAQEIEAMKLVAVHLLEPIREHFGVPFIPTSFFRCKELNDAVGSKDSSQHRKGQAADIEVPSVSNFALATWVKDNLSFDQLILENYTPGQPSSGWVHCSYKEQENRGEVLTFTGKKFLPSLVA